VAELTVQEKRRLAGAALDAVKWRLEGVLMDDKVGGVMENVVGNREECEGRALERIFANLKAEGGPEQTAERWGLEEAFPQREEWFRVLEERLRSAREGMVADEGKSNV
jgi:hypothetical protein